jgi:hypothetical protein
MLNRPSKTALFIAAILLAIALILYGSFTLLRRRYVQQGNHHSTGTAVLAAKSGSQDSKVEKPRRTLGSTL